MGEGKPENLHLKFTLTIFFENLREFHKIDQCIPVDLNLVASTTARTMQIINKPIEITIIKIVNHFEPRKEVLSPFLYHIKVNK
jgi:hypothetical protein